jgi:hypothetical protein
LKIYIEFSIKNNYSKFNNSSHHRSENYEYLNGPIFIDSLPMIPRVPISVKFENSIDVIN